MIGVAAPCLPILFAGYCIARWEGALLLAYYVAYVVFLILHAAEHDALPASSTGMVVFVLPLTALTRAVLVPNNARTCRRSPKRRES